VSFYAEERHKSTGPWEAVFTSSPITSARCSNSAKIPALNNRSEIIDRARLGARQARVAGRGPRPSARDRPGAGSRARAECELNHRRFQRIDLEPSERLALGYQSTSRRARWATPTRAPR
jgi:hypothetical protein